jgi:hypothetical protein
MGLDLVVLVALAGGLAVRVLAASGTWLNPDEALHYLLANQKSVTLAYRSSLTNAHPPLFVVLLYFWRIFGTSELALRSISVLTGTATIWLVSKWLGRAVDRTTGAVAAVLFAFLPPLVALSAEVRHYATLMLFMAVALYFLERAFQERSQAKLLFFAAILWAAILTHYSAFWFTCALAVYAAARILASRPGARFTFCWLASQLVAAATYVFLYVTHIRRIRGGAMAHEAFTGWLRSGIFRSGEESASAFVARTTTAVFQYLFASPRIGIVALAGFAGGLAVLIIRRLRPGPGTRADLALLLVLPFAFSCAGALVGVFPYGDTRHTVFLSLFAVAGISILLARLAARRAWLAVSLAAVLAGAVNIRPSVGGQFIPRTDQRIEWMAHLLTFAREEIPPDEPILADYQTALLLGYYLRGRDTTFLSDPKGELVVHEYGGRRILNPREWNFSRESLGVALQALQREYGLPRERLVWVIDAGWGPPLVDQRERFGGNICVFEVPVGGWPPSQRDPPVEFSLHSRRRSIKLQRRSGRVLGEPFCQYSRQDAIRWGMSSYR